MFESGSVVGIQIPIASDHSKTI